MLQLSDFTVCLDRVKESVFGYDLSSVSKELEQLIEILQSILMCLDQETTREVNLVFEYINTALGNKDYLLLIDLLEYELKPILVDRMRATE